MKCNEMDVNKVTQEKYMISNEKDKITKSIVEKEKNNSQTNIKINENGKSKNFSNQIKFNEEINLETLEINDHNCRDNEKIKIPGYKSNSKESKNCFSVNNNLPFNNNFSRDCRSNINNESLKKSVSFNTINAKKFLVKNNCGNQSDRFNRKKIEVDENLSIIQSNIIKSREDNNNHNNNKCKSKEKTLNIINEKTTKNNSNSNENNNNIYINKPNNVHRLRSILKSSSKDKCKNESFKTLNDEKFVPFHKTININSDFVERNKKIIFSEIDHKIIPKKSYSSIYNIDNELNMKECNNNINFDKSLNNFEKSNYSNFFPNQSPIRDRKSPIFSSSFVNESDGLKNIFLNRDKNLTILNLEKLYQGSFNKEFCELYSNNNNKIQNDSTTNRTMHATSFPKEINSNNYSKSEIKNTNFSSNYINLTRKNYENITNNNKKTKIKQNNEIKANNIPIQQLNKFFTKRANYNNLNYFSNNKKSDSRSREFYNTMEKNQNIELNERKLDLENEIVKSEKNQKLSSNISNIDYFPTFNNNQKIENDDCMNPTLNNKEKNNNNEEIRSERKFKREINNFYNEHEKYNHNQNKDLNNNTTNYHSNYPEYNSPFTSNKLGTEYYCQKLSNYHFVYKNRLEKLREEEQQKRCKSAKPIITKKAQNIIREGHLFHCRLYPYHKIQKFNSNKKPNNFVRDTYYNHNHNNININNIYYYNSTNNCNSASFVIENLRRLEGIEDIKTYRIYRTSKDQDYLNLREDNNNIKQINKSYNELSCSLNLNMKLKNHNNLGINSTSNVSKTYNLNRSFNCPNNKNNPFSFKPNLNIKSLNIAEKLTPAFFRLTNKASKEKKLDMTSNSDKYIKSQNKINLNNNNSNIFNDSSFSAKNSSILTKNNIKSRSNSKGEFNRSFELYRKGVQKLKKKEALHMQKIINEDEAYKQYPFKPQINDNFPEIFLANRAYKAENLDVPNNQITNVHNINYGVYLNKTNTKLNELNTKSRNNDNGEIIFNNSTIKSNNFKQFNQQNNNLADHKKSKPDEFFSNKSESNYIKNNINNNNNVLRNNSLSFYDKNIYWKQNVLKKFNKMREEKEAEQKINNTFKPDIQKNMMTPDAKFIEKNIGQIQEYVNKRRSYLQKANKELNYQRSKYNCGDNFKIRPTIPQEFNLSYKMSQEKLLSRSSSNILRGNKKNQAFGNSETKNNSRNESKDILNSTNTYLNRFRNIKKYDVNNLRNDLKIKEFFEFNEAFNQIANKEENDGLSKNNSRYNSNNKRSADLFSKNKNFLSQNFNRSFNNISFNHKNSDLKAFNQKNLNINEINLDNIPIRNNESELSVSEQIHNMPKDSYYHHNDLNNCDNYNNSNLENVRYYDMNNNFNAQDNFQSNNNSSNRLIDPVNNPLTHNFQINNYYLNNSNYNYKE